MIIIIAMQCTIVWLLFNLPQQYDTTKSMPSVAVHAYNYRYLQYEGTNRSASDVMSFIRMVSAHNLNDEEIAKYHEFEIKGINTVTDIISKKWYTIDDFVYDNDLRVVIGCTITEQDSYYSINN